MFDMVVERIVLIVIKNLNHIMAPVACFREKRGEIHTRILGGKSSPFLIALCCVSLNDFVNTNNLLSRGKHSRNLGRDIRKGSDIGFQ